jgi:hypothetical protein
VAWKARGYDQRSRLTNSEIAEDVKAQIQRASLDKTPGEAKKSSGDCHCWKLHPEPHKRAGVEEEKRPQQLLLTGQICVIYKKTHILKWPRPAAEVDRIHDLCPSGQTTMINLNGWFSRAFQISVSIMTPQSRRFLLLIMQYRAELVEM